MTAKITATGASSPALKRPARKRPSRARTRPAAPSAPPLVAQLPPAPQAAHGPSASFDPAFQAHAHDVVLLLVAGLNFFLAYELRPTRQDIDNIFLPAERILIRRLRLPSEVSPDVADIMEIVGGIGGYGARIIAAHYQPAPGAAGAGVPQQPAPAPQGPVENPAQSFSNGPLHSSLQSDYANVIAHARANATGTSNGAVQASEPANR